jgi:hypothetical protein
VKGPVPPDQITLTESDVPRPTGLDANEPSDTPDGDEFNVTAMAAEVMDTGVAALSVTVNS